MVDSGSFTRPQGRSLILLSAFAAVLALLVLAAIASAAPVNKPEPPADGPVEAAKMKQEGKALIFQVRTNRQIALKDLERKPDMDRPKATYLCFEMTRSGSKLISRICLGGKGAHHKVGVTRTNRVNKVYSKETLPARVKRVGNKKFVVSLDPGDARLRPSDYSWRTVYSDGTCLPGKVDCRTSFPKRHLASFDLRPVEIVGCTGGNGEFVTEGPRGKKRIALTFDDGPSLYTADVLRILRKHEVESTFFQIGQEVQRYPSESRKILAQGHEIGNHSTHHGSLPGASDMATTNSIIKRATGFRPCLFRPPGGAVSSGVFSAAAQEKLKVVNWDVDTNDWKQPGSGSILSSIRSARAGSIVLMHDGGGSRSQTIDALSAGIESLQRRGFELVTVTELLGNRFIYRPQ